MPAAATALTNGQTTAHHRPDSLLIELVRLRARCASQASAIAELEEDVAMFRAAAIALSAQNAQRCKAAPPPTARP
jgi:hypothetical protein